MKIFLYICCLMVAVLPTYGQAGTPVTVILDTDMGSDCDDVGALALLNAYVQQDKAHILAVIYSSGKVPYGVGVIDAVNRYYGHHDVPIGATYDTLVGDPVDKMQAAKLSRDTAAFHNRYIHNTDVPEQVSLLRKLLLAQPDTSVVYITIGHTHGLYSLLTSPADSLSPLTGEELITQKLKKWVALGALKANNADGHYVKDWNFFFNGTAPFTDYLVDYFPRPVYYVDAGSDVMAGRSLISSPTGNIVRTAYRDWLWNTLQQTLADQRPSWDLATVMYAVEGTGSYFEEQSSGYLEFDANKGCRWLQSDSPTRQYFVRQKKGTNQPLADYLNRMISSPK